MVQEPLVAVFREMATVGFGGQIDRLTQAVASNGRRRERRFAGQARKYLAPVVKKFFKAAESDLTTDEDLHALRIHGKKLRYTMEIVAPAFDPAFRKSLYSQMTLFQNLLGTVNDHATARGLFAEWVVQSDDAEQRAFVEGFLVAEQQAAEDLRAAFLATWTPKVVAKLKRKFRPYC
jgi:CHAD domain-containing protein